MKDLVVTTNCLILIQVYYPQYNIGIQDIKKLNSCQIVMIIKIDNKWQLSWPIHNSNPLTNIQEKQPIVEIIIVTQKLVPLKLVKILVNIALQVFRVVVIHNSEVSLKQILVFSEEVDFNLAGIIITYHFPMNGMVMTDYVIVLMIQPPMKIYHGVPPFGFG